MSGYQNNENTAHYGPVKWSNIRNRPAFKVVAKGFDDDIVRNLYLRDYYGVRTDNMIFWPEEGRENIDCFVGSSPVLEPILEDTFLVRLSDASFGTVVEESHFTSYPKVVSDSSFFEPDQTAPFVPRLKGLMRSFARNRKKERLISAESIFIRGFVKAIPMGVVEVEPRKIDMGEVQAGVPATGIIIVKYASDAPMSLTGAQSQIWYGLPEKSGLHTGGRQPQDTHFDHRTPGRTFSGLC